MKAQATQEAERELPPEGLTIGRCIKLIDLGTQESKYRDSVKHNRQILVMFELPDHRMELDGKDVPMAISKKYTLSFNSKSNLRKDMEQWYGTKFDDKQIEASGGFDPSKILGRPAQLMIVHNDSGGKTYANISGLMPLMAGVEAPNQENPSVLFDLDEIDWDVYDSFSEGMKSWIAKSPEFQELEATRSGSAQPEPVKEDYDDLPF